MDWTAFALGLIAASLLWFPALIAVMARAFSDGHVKGQEHGFERGMDCAYEATREPS